jgi:transposase
MTKSKPTDLKVRNLETDGILNPRPEVVVDELFARNEFFDRRDLVQVRYEMLRRVRTDGVSISETTARFGVSRPTYYRIETDFEREGMKGLLPRKRGPRDGHKLSATVVEELHAARERDPSMDIASLVTLLRDRFGIEVHPRTVERALLRQEKKTK